MHDATADPSSKTASASELALQLSTWADVRDVEALSDTHDDAKRQRTLTLRNAATALAQAATDSATIQRLEAMITAAYAYRLDFAQYVFGEDETGRWYLSAVPTVTVDEIRKVLSGSTYTERRAEEVVNRFRAAVAKTRTSKPRRAKKPARQPLPARTSSTVQSDK